MGDRNIAHTQEAPSLYLQGKHHTIVDYTGRCNAFKWTQQFSLGLFDLFYFLNNYY